MPDAPTIAVHPFGTRAIDLDIDFAHGDRPGLVTALLTACMPPLDAEHWWDRSVGARHRALLSMVRSMDGQVPAQRATCPACGERLEFELPLDELTASTVDEAPVDIVLDGGPLCLRRPSGRDLRAWQTRSARPPSRADILRSLVVDGELHDAEIGPAAQALASADPLVAFAVRLACPSCGEAADHDVDLETLALAALAARQRMLIDEVHRLAAGYGWTEAEVLSVPPWRRAHYLASIEAER